MILWEAPRLNQGILMKKRFVCQNLHSALAFTVRVPSQTIYIYTVKYVWEAQLNMLKVHVCPYIFPHSGMLIENATENNILQNYAVHKNEAKATVDRTC